MNQSPMIKFENDTAKSREQYKKFQGMAGRTNLALWEALGGGYAQILDYRSNAVLQAEFELALAAQKMRTSPKKVLLVTEYIYFSHVLHPGEGHKPDINKARTYAKVYDKAAVANITSAEFVPWVRENGGIQKIAHGETAGTSRRGQRPPLGKSARVKSNRISGPAVAVEQPGLRFPVLPGDVWYSNARVAAKTAKMLQAAGSQRQKIELVIYADGEELVVVGISSTPCMAPTPVADQRVPVGDRP